MAHKKMYAVCDNKSLVQINQILSATVPKTGWSSNAPYTQTVNVAGMSQYYNVTYAPDINEETSAADEKLIKKNIGYFSIFDTQDGKIKITCKSNKPTCDIPLIMKVV